MVVNGVIKMNKSVKDVDFITGLIREAGKDNTVQNSDVIKKEIYELADKIRHGGAHNFGDEFFWQISDNEYIDLDKPIIIKNGDLTAEVRIDMPGVNFVITDVLGNTEKGRVEFNSTAQYYDESEIAEYKSLKKVYMLLSTHDTDGKFSREIKDVEARLRWLVRASEKEMYTVEASDINNIKFFVGPDVIKAVESIIG